MSQYTVTISTDDEEVAEWIMAGFVETARTMEHYIEKGKPPAVSQEVWDQDVEEYETVRAMMYAAHDEMQGQINAAAGGR